MQHNHSQSPLDNQAQRFSGKALPPLSKYYYGPAQTWGPPDKSPISERNPGWGVSEQHEIPSNVPQRLSSTPSTYSFNQPPARTSPSLNTPQPWQVPGPSPSAPPVHQVIPIPYNSSTYEPITGSRQSPVNPAWNQGNSSLNSNVPKRGAKYNYHHDEQDPGQVSSPSLSPRFYSTPNGFNERSQLQPPLGSQISGSGASQAGQGPEFLQPVTYSPNYSPQMRTDAYRGSPSEGLNNTTPAQPERQLNIPRRVPPPLPPKLPQSCANNDYPKQEDTPSHASHYSQTERRNSETSLDQELRQYQQYSEKLHQFMDSSAVSVASSDHPKPEYGRGAYQSEPHSSTPSIRLEDSKHHLSHQDRRALRMPVAKENPPEIPSYDENQRKGRTTSPPLGTHPSNSLRQETVSEDKIGPAANLSNQLSSSSTDPPHGQSLKTQPSTQQHRLQGLSTNENASERQKNDHHQYPTRSQSSMGISDVEDQPNKTDSKSENPIIDRLDAKISSSASEQRHSEPLLKPPVTTQTTFAHYSSSALGFGGPSDWEHFGDYDAEEIDDTALYSRSEPKISADTKADAAELPVETLVIDKPSLPTEQSASEYASGPHTKQPVSLSQHQQVAPPLEPSTALETSESEHVAPSQDVSPSKILPEEESATPGRPPSLDPRSLSNTLLKLAQDSKGSTSDFIDPASEPSDKNPTILTPKSSTDSINHLQKPSQALQSTNTDSATQILPNNSVDNEAYLRLSTTRTESTQNSYANLENKPNISLKENNDTSYISADAMVEAGKAMTSGDILPQSESPDEKAKFKSKDNPTTMVPLAVNSDGSQIAKINLKSVKDESPATAEDISLSTVNANISFTQMKLNFQGRQKQSRKNSLQFQEKLKRFQPSSKQAQESATISQKRVREYPNKSHQGVLQRSERRSEEPKVDQHEIENPQSKLEQNQQGKFRQRPEQNKQVPFPEQFEQPRLAQQSGQSGQSAPLIGEFLGQSGSQQQVEQQNADVASYSKSQKLNALPRRPAYEDRSLEQSELDRLQLGRPKPEQVKLKEFGVKKFEPKEFELDKPKKEESKLQTFRPEEFRPEESKLEEFKQEKPMSEGPKSEKLNPWESKPENSEPEEPRLEEPKFEELKLKESKREEPKPEEPKPEESKPEEPKPEEPKPEEPKPEEPKLEELKPEEPRPEDSKRDDFKLEEPKPEELKPEELEPKDSKRDDFKLEEPKPEEPKPEEPKPEEPKPEDSKRDDFKLQEPKLQQPTLEQHTMLEEIMLEYPWVKQPHDHTEQIQRMNDSQPHKNLKQHGENTQQSYEALVDRYPEKIEKPRADNKPAGDSLEHVKAQNQTPIINNSHEQNAKSKESQEQIQDNAEQSHVRTWLDLPGSNNTEQVQTSIEILHDTSGNNARSVTSADNPDNSRDQGVTTKSLLPVKLPLDSFRNTADPTADQNNISTVNKTDADETAAEGLHSPSPKNPTDSIIKPPFDAASNVLINDDGLGVLYSDLDSWGRASLKRYMSMLREESKATTDKEKLDIFTIFINRESKLRAVLYGADDGPVLIQQTSTKNSVQPPARTQLQPSEKALPALPQNEIFQSPSIGSGSSGNQSVAPESIRSVPLGSQNESSIDQSSHLKINSQTDLPVDEIQYSPEGRPVLPRERIVEDKPKNSGTKVKTQREKVNKVLTQFTNYIYPATPPSSDAPTVVSPRDTQTLSPTPLKKNESQAEPIDYLSKRQSTYRPYAALTMGSLNSGVPALQESTFRPSSSGEKPNVTIQNEARQTSQNIKNSECPPEIATVKPKNQVEASPSSDLRRFVKSDFDSLNTVLPSSARIRQESIELRDMINAMDAVPDDFSFIHQCVVAWDAIAKKEREAYERARHARQGESERKFDELFNDNEIGYGDISELESEFKRSEAAKKADEDRHEYQTFLSDVFDVVWTRLHREIDELTPLYDEYSKVINDTLVGKDMFDESATSFALAPTMSCLLALHQKLEVRHQKAFEAVLERDRRLKKTEVSPWYTIGNVAKVKQLEKQFESAEKNANVEYCNQRDIRANNLMDVLDQNTLRGVGANQDYMESLMNGVRRVASGRAFASMPSSESDLGLDEVMKAKSVTTILANSSEQIVQTFHVADMLLNSADYEASVAKAKLINADAETFKRLKDEKSKEDLKLMRDLEHRLALIREDSRKTNDEIVKLMLFLGIQNGHAETQQPFPGPPDAGYEERSQKTLQDVKKRNDHASKEAQNPQ